jgi:hypothetical protein
MASCLDDAIGGFNSFVDGIRNDPDAFVTLVQFDNHYDVVYERRRASDVPKLTRETFVPRGSTALLDAMHRAICSARGNWIRKPTQEREKIIMIVITDGGENASHEVGKDDLERLVSSTVKDDGFDYVYVGVALAAFSDKANYYAAHNMVARAMNFAGVSTGSTGMTGAANIGRVMASSLKAARDGHRVSYSIAESYAMEAIPMTYKNGPTGAT